MNTDTHETERVLHIRFQRSDEQRVERLKAIDRGESPEPYFETVFHEMEDLQTVTRPTNLTLFRTIAREQPESIRETARLVDRDVRQVHRNLEELDELGVIDLEADGRTKRPRSGTTALKSICRSSSRKQLRNARRSVTNSPP